MNANFHSGDKIDLKGDGDISFSKDNATSVVANSIVDSFNQMIDKANSSDELKIALKELALSVQGLTSNMSSEKAKEVNSDLEILVGEAIKEKPRKKWYELSAQGLIDAAKTVGSIGKPVIETTQSILKMLSP